MQLSECTFSVLEFSTGGLVTTKLEAIAPQTVSFGGIVLDGANLVFDSFPKLAELNYETPEKLIDEYLVKSNAKGGVYHGHFVFCEVGIYPSNFKIPHKPTGLWYSSLWGLTVDNKVVRKSFSYCFSDKYSVMEYRESASDVAVEKILRFLKDL